MSGCCVWLVVGMERLFIKMPQFENGRVLLLSKRDASSLGEYDGLDLTYAEFQMLYGHPRGSEQ